MRKRIKNYLNEPFTLFLSYPVGQLYFSLTILVLAALINLSQPFGLNNWNETHKWLVISGYLIIYAGTYRFIYLIGSQFYPRYYCPHSWTRLKELQVLKFYIPIVTIVGWIFTEYAIEELVWTYKTFFRLQFYNCLLGLIVLPVFKQVVFPKIKSKHQPIPTAVRDNVQVAAQETNTENNNTVTDNPMAVNEPVSVTSNRNDVPLAVQETSTEEYITVKDKCIAVKKIIYAVSDRNHVHVWFLHNGTMIEIIERCTMKEFKTRFNEFPQFLHCHESFLVNLNDIASWSMTADRMEIQLKSCNEIIPVSRMKQAFMKEILNSHYILRLNL